MIPSFCRTVDVYAGMGDHLLFGSSVVMFVVWGCLRFIIIILFLFPFVFVFFLTTTTTLRGDCWVGKEGGSVGGFFVFIEVLEGAMIQRVYTTITNGIWETQRRQRGKREREQGK